MARIQYAGADDTGTKYRVINDGRTSIVYVRERYDRESASTYVEIDCTTCRSACCTHCAAVETAIAKAEGR